MSAHPRLLSRLETFLASERGRRILNRFYSWGAAFVILGALFKLLHIRYGDEILLVSMLTEFVVFFISGFERPEKSYNWEAVFPNFGNRGGTPLRVHLTQRGSHPACPAGCPSPPERDMRITESTATSQPADAIFRGSRAPA